jgi:AraC-like DNA-binding protein
VGVSRSGLHRKVKSMLGTSPMEFLREARIRKAAQLLSQTSKTVSEVAYACGFSDPKYFSKCFKAAIGQTPTEYKKEVIQTSSQ